MKRSRIHRRIRKQLNANFTERQLTIQNHRKIQNLFIRNKK